VSESHLKPYQHYADLYDRLTVEHCRRMEQVFKDKKSTPPKGEKISKAQLAQLEGSINNLLLYHEKGERYLAKKKMIEEWMEADRKKDALYQNAQPPEDIRCLTCRNRMTVINKELYADAAKGDRVLFMYECPNKCLPRRAFFSDGTEWRTTPDRCPTCSEILSTTMEDTGEKLITTNTCTQCGYSNIDEYVWKKQEEEIDVHFAKDRDRFCLTDTEGQKYFEHKLNMERLSALFKELEATEKARQEKLKANPNGFHLEGKGYTCAICGNHTPEGDNWFDQYGIKCLVCQKAIDVGEIPATLAKDKVSWYSEYEVKSAFNITAPTLRRWIKDGTIKSRTITHYGIGKHAEIFLIEDNKGFLPPKKLVGSKMVSEIKDGREWNRFEPWYRFVDPFKHLKGYKIMDYMQVVDDDHSAKK
jgi:Zn ribbon nucleic-acid-binding protein